MNLRMQVAVCVIAAITIAALAYQPYSNTFTFDPLGWISDSINGFFDLVKMSFEAIFDFFGQLFGGLFS